MFLCTSCVAEMDDTRVFEEQDEMFNAGDLEGMGEGLLAGGFRQKKM